MPDEEVKTEPKVETPPAAPAIDNDKLAAGIADGVIKGMKALRETEQQPVVVDRPAAIVDVDPDEIEAAREAGDKEKVRNLTRQQRLADQQRYERSVEEQIGQGRAAIGQLAEQAVANDTYFKKYEGEVRKAMADFVRQNPKALVTPEHWKAALRLVKGDHADDIAREAVETSKRQARDDSPAPGAPGGGRDIAPPDDREPTTLAEEFGPAFQQRFKEKQRAVGTRSEDEEVRQFDRAFRAKMPNEIGADGKATKRKPVETVAGYLAERREIQKIAEEDPSLGLGS
jgi:hypothetical protein